ncbi:unnamed protein product, partial [Prorocentrum cordatum]
MAVAILVQAMLAQQMRTLEQRVEENEGRIGRLQSDLSQLPWWGDLLKRVELLEGASKRRGDAGSLGSPARGAWQAAARRLGELEAAQSAAEAAVHGQLGMLEADQGDLQSQAATFGMRIEALEKGQASSSADIKDLQKRLRREENRLNEVAQFASVVQEDKISSLEEKFDEMQLWLDGRDGSLPSAPAPAAALQPAEGAPPPVQEGRLAAVEHRIEEISAWIAGALERGGGLAPAPLLEEARPAAEHDAAAAQQEKITALERRIEELHSWIAAQNRVATPRQGPATPRQTLGTPRMSPRDAGRPVLAKLPLGNLAAASGLPPLREAATELGEDGACTPRQGPATPRQTLGMPRMSPRDAGRPVVAKLPLGNLAAASGLAPLQEIDKELDEEGSATSPVDAADKTLDESFDTEPQGERANESEGGLTCNVGEPHEVPELRPPSRFLSCFSFVTKATSKACDRADAVGEAKPQEMLLPLMDQVQRRLDAGLAECDERVAQQIAALERRLDELLGSRRDHDGSPALPAPAAAAHAPEA